MTETAKKTKGSAGAIAAAAAQRGMQVGDAGQVNLAATFGAGNAQPRPAKKPPPKAVANYEAKQVTPRRSCAHHKRS